MCALFCSSQRLHHRDCTTGTAGTASVHAAVARWKPHLDNDEHLGDAELFGLLSMANLIEGDAEAVARVTSAGLVSAFRTEVHRVKSAAGCKTTERSGEVEAMRAAGIEGPLTLSDGFKVPEGYHTRRDAARSSAAFWLDILTNDTSRTKEELVGLLSKGNLLGEDGAARVLANPLVSVFMAELSKANSAAVSVSTNRGADRGRSGKGGAKAWGLVLYEIAPERVDPKEPTERFFEHYVHAMNDGYKGGEGSEVTEDNFMSYARVSVNKKQSYINTHKSKGNIVQARVVLFPVDEPEDRKNHKKAVVAWYN